MVSGVRQAVTDARGAGTEWREAVRKLREVATGPRQAVRRPRSAMRGVRREERARYGRLRAKNSEKIRGVGRKCRTPLGTMPAKAHDSMKTKDLYRHEAMLRAKQFLADHPMANAHLAATETALSDVLNEIQAHCADQDLGGGISAGGTSDCERIAARLRSRMRLVSDIAKTLDPKGFPSIAAQLKMPRDSYPALETAARTFLEVVAPIKEAFVERMMPEDFAETLRELLDAFNEARGRKYSGRARQVGGTAGTEDAVRRGMRHVRALDAMLSVAYADDPSRLAAWKAAVRIKREPHRDTGGQETDSLVASTSVSEMNPSPGAETGTLRAEESNADGASEAVYSGGVFAREGTAPFPLAPSS
jgi:hypothetical protein